MLKANLYQLSAFVTPKTLALFATLLAIGLSFLAPEHALAACDMGGGGGCGGG